MTQGEMIRRINELATHLKSLTDDPHPGLFTWNAAVGQTLAELASLAPKNRKPSPHAPGCPAALDEVRCECGFWPKVAQR